MVTVYVEETNELMFFVVDPLLQLYINGAVPLLTFILTNPLLPPLQLTFPKPETATVGDIIVPIVTLAVLVQRFISVTVTV